MISAYNERQIAAGNLTPAMLSVLAAACPGAPLDAQVRYWQHRHRLAVDGMAGPATQRLITAFIAASEPEPVARARAAMAARVPPPSGWAAGQAIRYRLGEGGGDPLAAHPADWSENRRQWEVDCSGFAAWCLGIARRHRAFPLWDGYISTTSIWHAAGSPDGTEAARWFRFVDAPRPGDLVVYPNRYALGIRVGIGHVGIVSRAPTGANVWTARVIDAASRPSNKLGRAITERDDASIWQQRGRFVRYMWRK